MHRTQAASWLKAATAHRRLLCVVRRAFSIPRKWPHKDGDTWSTFPRAAVRRIECTMHGGNLTIVAQTPQPQPQPQPQPHGQQQQHQKNNDSNSSTADSCRVCYSGQSMFAPDVELEEASGTLRLNTSYSITAFASQSARISTHIFLPAPSTSTGPTAALPLTDIRVKMRAGEAIVIGESEDASDLPLLGNVSLDVDVGNALAADIVCAGSDGTPLHLQSRLGDARYSITAESAPQYSGPPMRVALSTWAGDATVQAPNGVPVHVEQEPRHARSPQAAGSGDASSSSSNTSLEIVADASALLGDVKVRRPKSTKRKG